MLQVFVAETTSQTIFLVAIFLLELDECLAIARVGYLQSALLPHSHDVVVLSLELFKQVERQVAKFVFALVSPVGEEHGNGGVDDEQVQRGGRDVFFRHAAAGKAVRLRDDAP